MSFFNLQAPERRDVNGIHNPFENPAVPLSSIGLDNQFGLLDRSDSGESVTNDTVMTIPTFWRCVALLANIVAGCPLRAYRTNDKDEKDEITPDLLSTQNGDMRHTQFELWHLVVAQLATWGNAYVLKYRDPTVGRNRYLPPDSDLRVITDLRPLDPSRVSVKFDKRTRQKMFEVTRIDSEGNPVLHAAPIELDTSQVMHIMGLSLDGITGLSPVQNFARTLGTAIAADKLAGRFYSKGTLLSGLVKIKVPLPDQETADAIRQRWIQRSGGVAHGGDVAVMDADSDFVPLTIPPDALQFLESRRWSTTEVARMFGIPPHLVGDVEKTTSWGTGIEQQNIAFASYTVSGYTNPIEQRVSRECIPASTQFCEFDLNRLMRGSMQERFNAYRTAITTGWLTRNEARQFELMPKLPGLDEPLTPMNMIPNDEVGQEQANSEAGPEAGGNSGADAESAGNSSMAH